MSSRPLITSIEGYMKRPDPPSELALLAEDIREAHARVFHHAGQALRFALECGELLCEAKARVPHGQWEVWLDSNRPDDLSVTMARIYMRLHHHRSLLPDTTTTITGALQALGGEPNQSPMSDRRNAAAAIQAAEPELTIRQIAERVEAAPSTVQVWLNPVTAQKQERRYLAKRKRKSIPCPHCGGLLHNDGTPAGGDDGR